MSLPIPLVITAGAPETLVYQVYVCVRRGDAAWHVPAQPILVCAPVRSDECQQVETKNISLTHTDHCIPALANEHQNRVDLVFAN